MADTPATPKKLRLVPDWIVGVGGLLTLLFVLFNLYYWLGFGGVSMSGSDMSFNREHDVVMFQIDEGKAFAVRSESSISLVKYRPGMPPFRPLCGKYESAGVPFEEWVSPMSYMHGDWVYSQYPQWEGVDALNIQTGETITVDPPEPPLGQEVDMAAIPEFAAHGLDFAPEKRLTIARLVENYDQLRVINESCMTLNAAFLALYALLVVFVLLALPIRLIRRRRAST